MKQFIQADPAFDFSWLGKPVVKCAGKSEDSRTFDIVQRALDVRRGYDSLWIRVRIALETEQEYANKEEILENIRLIYEIGALP